MALLRVRRMRSILGPLNDPAILRNLFDRLSGTRLKQVRRLISEPDVGILMAAAGDALSDDSEPVQAGSLESHKRVAEIERYTSRPSFANSDPSCPSKTASLNG